VVRRRGRLGPGADELSGLRRYLYAVLAVCVAFAAGVALAGGPLQRDQGTDRTEELTAGNAELSDEITQLEQAQVFDEAMSQVTGSRLLDDQLDGRTVSLVALPGVPDDTVRGVTNAVRDAGGILVVTARVSPTYVDPAQRTYVDSVADNSADGPEVIPGAEQGETYERMGALVARAYVGSGDDTLFDDVAAKIDSELRGAELLEVEGEIIRRGQLVAVLASGDHGGDDQTSAGNLIRSELIDALADGADAVLVAAPPTSTANGGLLDSLAAGGGPAADVFSTINVVDSGAGQIAAAYALAAAASGDHGNYGVDGGEVVLPPGLADPDQ